MTFSASISGRNRSAVLGLAAIVALTGLAGLVGCAVPRPAPPTLPATPIERDDPTPLDDSALDSEIQQLMELGAYATAVDLLRDELRLLEADVSHGALRLLLAETLEMAGDLEAAAVEYSLMPETASRDERGAAWRALARLRLQAGDSRGAARTLLRVDQGRDAQRAVQSLRTVDLQRLEFETRGWPGHDLAAQELRDRRESMGREDTVVALLVPISGRFEQFGAAFQLGAELALAARNEALPDGQPVRVVVRDTEGSIAEAGRAARGAILEDAVDAILGPLLSGPALAAGGIAQAYRVPLIAPTATDPAIREVGSFVLTLEPSPLELVRPLADFAVGSLGGRRFGALVPDDGVSDVFERDFRLAVEEAGGSVVLSLVYEPDQRDFRKLLDRFVDARVDGVYMPGAGTTLESLAPQLDFYEFDRRVLGHGGWMSARVLDPGNLALEGALFSSSQAEQPESEFMFHLMRQVWDATRQEVSRFHVRGWQSMEALLTALDAGAADGEAVVDILSRRVHWAGRPASEAIELLTYRDGALGPAAWALGFDLVPKKLSEPEEEEEDAADAERGETGGTFVDPSGLDD